MKHDPAELLKEALKLPPEVRAALAGSLLDSLDQEVDEDVEVAWQTEIDRRLRELDSGSVQPFLGLRLIEESLGGNGPAIGRVSPRGGC